MSLEQKYATWRALGRELIDAAEAEIVEVQNRIATDQQHLLKLVEKRDKLKADLERVVIADKPMTTEKFVEKRRPSPKPLEDKAVPPEDGSEITTSREAILKVLPMMPGPSTSAQIATMVRRHKWGKRWKKATLQVTVSKMARAGELTNYAEEGNIPIYGAPKP
jgi:hypothetical protein